MGHLPVMLHEVVECLDPKDGDVIVDGTFGGGGYAKALLAKADCQIIGVDRDETALERAEELMTEGFNIVPIHGRFSQMDELIANQNMDQVDGVVLDIGVSSFQIDEAERGFSFQKDGPLDMRMDITQRQTAADLVNEVCEQELADILFKFGDERHSRRIAKAIVKYREEEKPFETTLELANVIASAMPGKKAKDIHPATRSFQALRIAVNEELSELQQGLRAAKAILKHNGRLVVVTFHSLEDQIVKNFFREESGNVPSGSRYLPETDKNISISFVLQEKKARSVSDQEAKTNPRARSAKLRWGLRVRD